MKDNIITNSNSQDKKMPLMPLGKYHKIRFLFWLFIFILTIIRLIPNKIITYSSITKSIFIVLSIISFILTIIFCIKLLHCFSAYQLEKDDELSTANMTKAYATISKIVMVLLAVGTITLLITNFRITIEISRNNITNIWFIIISVSSMMESGLFLFFEKKSGISNFDEEEE